MVQRYSRQVNRARCSDGTSLPFCSNSNVGKAVEDCMRAIIGVLVNLTHDNGGSRRLGPLGGCGPVRDRETAKGVDRYGTGRPLRVWNGMGQVDR
jgi:hypothetical protein